MLLSYSLLHCPRDPELMHVCEGRGNNPLTCDIDCDRHRFSTPRRLCRWLCSPISSGGSRRLPILFVLLLLLGLFDYGFVFDATTPLFARSRLAASPESLLLLALPRVRHLCRNCYELIIQSNQSIFAATLSHRQPLFSFSAREAHD